MPARKWNHLVGGIQKNRRKVLRGPTPRKSPQRRERSYSQGSPEQRGLSDVLTATTPPQAQHALQRFNMQMSPATPTFPSRPEIECTHVFPQDETKGTYLLLPQLFNFFHTDTLFQSGGTPGFRKRSNSISSEISLISNTSYTSHATKASSYQNSQYSQDQEDDGPQTPVSQRSFRLTLEMLF